MKGSQLSYSFLREIQKKEIESSALVELTDDFYSEVSGFLREKKGEALKGSSMLTIREYENLKKIVSSIQGRREEKILLMALRTEKSQIGLTREEKEMLLGLQGLLKGYREKVTSAVGEPEAQDANVSRIRMLTDVEKYKGAGDHVYGPFRKDQEYHVPPEEAEWLMKNKMAVRQ